jgi:hypothetical protein
MVDGHPEVVEDVGQRTAQLRHLLGHCLEASEGLLQSAAIVRRRDAGLRLRDGDGILLSCGLRRLRLWLLGPEQFHNSFHQPVERALRLQRV